MERLSEKKEQEIREYYEQGWFNSEDVPLERPIVRSLLKEIDALREELFISKNVNIPLHTRKSIELSLKEFRNIAGLCSVCGEPGFPCKYVSNEHCTTVVCENHMHRHPSGARLDTSREDPPPSVL